MYLSTTSIKQIGMICKINEPFHMMPLVYKKGIKTESLDKMRQLQHDYSVSQIFIQREYDGSERYVLLVPSESKDKFISAITEIQNIVLL